MEELYETLNLFAKSIKDENFYLRDPQELREIIKLNRKTKIDDSDTLEDKREKRKKFDILEERFKEGKLSISDIKKHFLMIESKDNFLQNIRDIFSLNKNSDLPENTGIFSDLKPIEGEKENYLNIYFNFFEDQSIERLQLDIPIGRIFEDGELKINSRFMQGNLSNEEIIENFEEYGNNNFVFFDKETNQLTLTTVSENKKNDISINKIKIDYNPENLTFNVKEYDNYIFNKSTHENIHHKNISFLNEEDFLYSTTKKINFTDGGYCYYKKTIDPKNPEVLDIEYTSYSKEGSIEKNIKCLLDEKEAFKVESINHSVDSLRVIINNGYTQSSYQNENNEDVKTLNYLNGHRKIFVDNSLVETYNDYNKITRFFNIKEDVYKIMRDNGNTDIFMAIEDSKNEGNFVHQQYINDKLISETFYRESENKRVKLYTTFHSEDEKISKILYNDDDTNGISRINYKDGTYKTISPDTIPKGNVDFTKKNSVFKHNVEKNYIFQDDFFQDLGDSLPVYNIAYHNSEGNIYRKEQVLQIVDSSGLGIDRPYTLDESCSQNILLHEQEFSSDGEKILDIVTSLEDSRKIDLMPVKTDPDPDPDPDPNKEVENYLKKITNQRNNINPKKI